MELQGALCRWYDVYTSWVAAEVWAGDGEGLPRAAIPFYRLQAVFAMRCALPECARLVPGLCAEGGHILDSAGAAGAGAAGAGAGAGALRTAASPAALVAASPLPGPKGTPLATSMASPGIGGAGGSGAPAASAISIPRILTVTLPLPMPHPLAASLPSWLVGDVAEVIGYFYRSTLRRLPFSMCDEDPSIFNDLCTFFILYLGSQLHLANPHSRGELAMAFSLFVPHAHDAWRADRDLELTSVPGSERTHLRGPAPALHQQLSGHEAARRYLLPALAGFYVDIAAAGSHRSALGGRCLVDFLLSWHRTHTGAHTSPVPSPPLPPPPCSLHGQVQVPAAHNRGHDVRAGHAAPVPGDAGSLCAQQRGAVHALCK